MNGDRLHFQLLNLGHFLDHLFMLIFATVAALALSKEWGLGYGDLIKYATPGFFAFGVFALPAGWMADKWSRDGMMSVFFFGLGLTSIATAMAQTPMQVAVGLFVIGAFAAIYHPVGLAIVTLKWKNTGIRIAVNGVWGNLGVACAALLTGYLIDHGGWRLAFVAPGVFSLVIGLVYLYARWGDIAHAASVRSADKAASRGMPADHRALLFRISAIVFLTAAVSSIIFQSTTFALPKIFDERLQSLTADIGGWLKLTGLSSSSDLATIVGAMAFIVFAVASLAQLVVGRLLDLYGPRPIFIAMACLQLVFFGLMPGLTDGLALVVALGFMLGAFGQIPINDFLIGKLATSTVRARVYAVRYVVSFTVLAAALPLIAVVYERWGFDRLFQTLSAAALVLLLAVMLLPRRMPVPATA